jgi:hypothetical protein
MMTPYAPRLLPMTQPPRAADAGTSPLLAPVDVGRFHHLRSPFNAATISSSYSPNIYAS